LAQLGEAVLAPVVPELVPVALGLALVALALAAEQQRTTVNALRIRAQFQRQAHNRFNRSSRQLRLQGLWAWDPRPRDRPSWSTKRKSNTVTGSSSPSFNSAGRPEPAVEEELPPEVALDVRRVELLGPAELEAWVELAGLEPVAVQVPELAARVPGERARLINLFRLV
jgi:hypothetical protein